MDADEPAEPHDDGWGHDLQPGAARSPYDTREEQLDDLPDHRR